MQNKYKLILLFSLIIIGAAIIIINYFTNIFSWKEDYKMDGTTPYGTQVISLVLESNNEGHQFHRMKSLTDSTLKDFVGKKNMNYIFIGNRYYADSAVVNNLFEFVAKGNNAFIAANDFPEQIYNLLYDECNEDESIIEIKTDSAAKINLYGLLKTQTDYTINYNYLGRSLYYSWNYFNTSAFCNNVENISALGKIIDDKVNFIRIKYGFGNLFLHLTPIVFTNYHLTNKEARTYSEHAFSVLPEGDIIWDEYNKLPKYNYTVGEEESSAGPLMFILSRESLRWAWYITLSLLALYIIFIGKRRQRIIPVIEPVRNTTLDYIKTVGKLYFLERDHRAVCMHKMKHFQAFLRNRYFILTTQNNDEAISKISLVSGVSKELISDIFIQFSLITVRTILTDKELIDFHNSLTKFYKECI